MSLTNQDISQSSLCHLNLGSSMVRASHRRSEGCGFDSRLGLRNIFWVCECLSSQKAFLHIPDVADIRDVVNCRIQPMLLYSKV